MVQLRSLEVRGYGDQPVPNTLLAQEDATEHLGIILPGMGYTAHMPLLYYSAEILLAIGADVLAVEYNYSRNEAFKSASDAEQARWLMSDVTSVCRAVLSQRSYSRITLVGKSLGTIAVALLLTGAPEFPNAEAIWLTPVLRWEPFMERVQSIPGRGRSLTAIGTADHHYDPALLSQFERATGSRSILVEGADHSIQIKGDVFASLRALERVVRGIDTFLREA